MPSRKFLVAFVVFVAAGWWGYEQAVDNFHVRYIHLKEWPALSEKISPERLFEARSVLDQPFSYLDKGRQFYAFVSQDGKYILKFIKCQRFNEYDIPFIKEMRRERIKEKQARLTALFQSSALSLELLSDLTGVIFTHLEKRAAIEENITIIDRIGIRHVVAIDEVPFVLQYRAQKIVPTFEALYQEKNTPEIYRRIDQLIDLFMTRARRKVIDIDDGIFLRDNIGFLEDKAIFIDIGTFVRSEKSLTKERLKEDFDKLLPLVLWIEKRDPSTANYFLNKISKAIHDSN